MCTKKKSTTEKKDTTQNQSEQESNPGKKQAEINSSNRPNYIIFGPLVSLMGIIVANMASNHILVSLMLLIFMVSLVWTFHDLRMNQNIKNFGSWVVFAAFCITFGFMVYLSFSSQFLKTLTYGPSTPTPICSLCPTEVIMTPYPTCGVTICPPQECPDCPTQEPTPTPTQAITPTPPPPWNFKDGCITIDWVRDTNWYSSLIKTPQPGNSCFDYSKLGFTSGPDGLLIKLGLGEQKINEPYHFGIYRELPKNLISIEIIYKWEEIKYSNDNPTAFYIGIINTEEENFSGKYLSLISKSPYWSPYVSFGSTITGEVSIDSSTRDGEKTIILRCENDEYQSLSCFVTIDGKQKKNGSTQKIDKWDSLLIGYDIPVNGGLKLLITDINIPTEQP